MIKEAGSLIQEKNNVAFYGRVFTWIVLPCIGICISLCFAVISFKKAREYDQNFIATIGTINDTHIIYNDHFMKQCDGESEDFTLCSDNRITLVYGRNHTCNITVRVPDSYITNLIRVQPFRFYYDKTNPTSCALKRPKRKELLTYCLMAHCFIFMLLLINCCFYDMVVSK